MLTVSAQPLKKAEPMFTNLARLFSKFARSLSFKLSFYAGFIMFVALLAFAYHSISTQEANLRERMIEGALRDSEVIKAAIWNGMMTKDREVIRHIVRAIGHSGGFGEINIYDTKEQLLYSSHAIPTEIDGDRKPGPLLDNLQSDPTVRHRLSDDGNWLHLVNPLVNTKSCSTAACHAHPPSEKVLGALSIKLPMGNMRKEIYTQARGTVIFAFLLFILISSVIGLAVIFLVNPSIWRLQENAAKMARGEYSPITPVLGSDEIAELSRSFDEMSRQINERTMVLLAGREMYKTLFEEVPCYLTVVDRNYRIVMTNKAFRYQFGDQVGKHCFTGYKGLDAKCLECPVEKTFFDGLPHQSEETWRVHGRQTHVIVKTGPIFDDNGHISEVLEMALDVTRLKQLQIELEKKQEEYKYLFENVPCYLTVVDRDYRIIQANKLFESHFGYNIGEHCFKVYKKKEFRCDNCPVEQTFVDGLTHTSEHVWLRNGNQIRVIARTSPVTNQDGEIYGVMEMCTDITEVVRLQQELALLGETIAGMSHTIKNILSGLQGGVYVVDSGLLRGKEERVTQGWAMVKNNVEKVSELVQGILYASKERDPEYKLCDPGTILAEVCDLYASRAASEGISLRRDFKREMGQGLLDPAGIHSVLSNLLSNAVAACRQGPRKERHITVSGRIEEGSLIFEVADDGIGMPQEVRDRLFTKFYSTKGSKGTGLGLVITRKVVEEHGGTIAVESEPGLGTSFLIEIPFDEAEDKKVLQSVV